MTISGFLFLLIGMICAMLIRLSDKDSGFPALTLFWYHLFLSCAYYWYSIVFGADSMDYFEVADASFGIGTEFVTWLTVTIRDLTSATYFDLFMLFHLAGYFGIWLLYKIIEEASLVRLQGRFYQMVCVLLFLPGGHFWTSAIGKDGLIFLGIMLVSWGLLRPRDRVFTTILGTFLVFMIRPHIAGIMLVCGGLSILTSKNISMTLRLVGFTGAFIIIAAAIPTIFEYVQLEYSSPEDIGDYISLRQGFNQQGGGGVDIREYPFVLQFLTYLYRPLFFDAPTIFGIAASAENVIYISFSVLLLTPSFLQVIKTQPNVLFIRFNLIYILLTTSVLATTTANLGISVRQKMMVMPSLIILILVTYSFRRYKKMLVSKRKETLKPESLEFEPAGTLDLSTRS